MRFDNDIQDRLNRESRKRVEMITLTADSECPIMTFADEILRDIVAATPQEYPGKVHRAIYTALRRKCS